MIVRLSLAFFVFLAILFPQSAEAKKVALIIGNANYEFASPLDNPPNDAALVAASAREAGFEVTIVEDLNYGQFNDALRAFRNEADGAEVAMVYYAGHGIEGKGENWLIPVDAKLEADRDLPFEGIELDLVVDTLSGAQVRMIVLDACRNSPFGRSWRTGTRAVSRGLVEVEADDVIVIYAAAPGQTASDGDGGNSPFAQSLADRLPQPDSPLQLLGGLVRDDVLEATGGDQRPFVSASVTGTPIYLVPRTPGGAPAAPIRFIIDNIVITCVSKTSGPGKDDLYLLVNTGDRVPEESGEHFGVGKGDVWTIGQSFSSIAPIALTLMEDDWIGDDDNLGVINTGTAEGTFTKTLRQDGGEFTVTYDLRLGT